MKNISCLLAFLMFIGLGCGGVRDVHHYMIPDDYTPTVHLVKDGLSYYLQWDSPLLEERIVLIRKTVLHYEIALEPESKVESQHVLLWRFRTGEYRSPRFWDTSKSFGISYAIPQFIVEILPASDLLNLQPPTPVGWPLKSITESRNHSDYRDEILPGDPLKSYQLGTPSKLTFSRKDKSQ